MAGAPSTPSAVSCPYEVDQASVATCAVGGHAALVGGVGRPTVQEAIDAAPPGGTVTVCPGTHVEVLETAMDLTLTAADPRPYATVLDGSSLEVARVLTVTGGTVRGLTLGPFHGRGPRAFGPTVQAGGDVTFECITGRDAAGALLLHRADVLPGTMTVRHSTFAGIGGGAVVASWGSGAIVVEDSSFTDNRLVFGREASGAAVYGAGPVTIRRSTFAGNVMTGATAGGGAVALDATGHGGDRQAWLTIEDSLFEDNEAPGQGRGGAVYVAAAAAATVTGSTFRSNVAGRGAGALSAHEVAVEVRDSTFAANDSARDGAIEAEQGLVLERVRFEDNTTGAGGAVVTATEGAVTAIELVAVRNEGPEGALSVSGSGALTCTCCDLGTGADDNVPVDLTSDGLPTDEATADFTL